MTRRRAPGPCRIAAAIATLALAACSAVAPVGGPLPGVHDPAARWTARHAGSGGFEQRLRARALNQGRQGRLAEAATSWEILTVLRPDMAVYGQHLSETRRLIESALPERLQRAAQAHKRGELDAAAVQYLAALALQPDHAQAADALRAIERERNRRTYLGKFSRLTLTRRAAADARMAGIAPAVPLDRNEVEHAALLASQGELEEAIALLERHLAADRGDATACQLLADVYFQQGEKQAPRDKPAAIAALEKSLRLDASNAPAAARLRQLRNGIVPTAASPSDVACSLR